MASGTSDQTGVPHQEGDESSRVLDPSIEASLQRTSSVVSESIAAGDNLSTGMEPSLPVASSKTSEIVETEADPSPGMEPSLQTASSTLDPVEDKQSSETGSSSSPKISVVNPFIEGLSEVNDDKDALAKYCSILKQRLDDGLQEKAVYAFLKHDNMMEAQVKVQELFNLFEAIELGIKEEKREGMPIERLLKKTQIPRIDSNQQNFREHVCRIDIYYYLFIHALNYAKFKLRDPQTIIGPNHSDSMIVAFMAFLINKVQEEDIMDPSLTFQKMYEEAKTKVTIYVQSYEEETVSTFICLVVNDKEEEAEYLFKSLLKLMNPSDIINRGRVYNDALQKAEELLEVYKFLSHPSLSQRYKLVLRRNDLLNGLAMEFNSQDKVHNFLVGLFLRDVELQQKINWKFVEQYDYPYLIHCVWEFHESKGPCRIEQYDWTPLQLNYVFTSSAAIFGGQGIMECLLKTWPALINAPYKGVAALHVATFKRNKEVIIFLLKQKELDINMRTGRGLTTKDIKKYLKNPTISRGAMQSTGVQQPFATVEEDRDQMIKDLLHQLNIEVNPASNLPNAAKKFIQNMKIAGKKWNKNRWELPTYQTTLHIATTERYAKVVKLLCEGSETPIKLHRHIRKLRCHEEDEEDCTPVDIIYRRLDSFAKDPKAAKIEKILLSMQDVQIGKDRLYRNRQVLVDAVNTILVVAALIAGVTYAGWLQPPLGYAQDYALAVPYPAPPDTYDSYLPVQGNFGVKVFALFNSLSFFFAIATVIVGADAVFPAKEYKYIGHVVETMRALLQHAIRFLIVSLVCVLGAFGSAAIVVLPPSLFFRKDLVLSIIVGGGVCAYVLWQLLSRHSATMTRINDYIANIIKYANVY